MTDRELLEYAAKAAGVQYEWVSDSGVCVGVEGNQWNGGPKYWNPLNDDGDALRLAVPLDMEVRINRVDGWTEIVFGYSVPMTAREAHGDDPYAATRRAIVRAAAEIGRSMQ